MSAKVAVLIALPLLCISMQRLGTAAVRCGDADFSKLAKVVYVSPVGNDSNGCGQSTTSPCKTIQQGITNCGGEGCGVLVRYGVYNAANPLSLADGVSLYGSCVFDETSYPYRSTIMGNPAVQAKGIKKPTVIQGFVILGSSAVHTAEASVAITVNDCSGLVFRQDVLASGKGGSGGNGNTPAAGTGATGGYALNAVDGAQGGNACYLSPPSGTTGKSGKGANRNQIHSSWGLNPRADCKSINDSLSQTGNSSGSVIGGVAGGRGTAGCACQGGGGNAGDGGDGGAGKMGGKGAQGGSPNPDTKGGFAGTIWRPNSGITGTPGQVGSGGGGGGGCGGPGVPAHSRVELLSRSFYFNPPFGTGRRQRHHTRAGWAGR